MVVFTLRSERTQQLWNDCVQVDLGRLTFLTVVGTQGRYARNTGIEFTRAYRLNYSRNGLLWKSWRNRLGNSASDRNTFTAEGRA